MTAQKDLKALVRGRMAKTGESYTAARSHLARTSVEADGPPISTSDDWRVLRALTKSLGALLEALAGDKVFTPAPPKEDAFDPETGTPVLDDTWRLELVSTVRRLAALLQLSSETKHLDGRHEFSWVNPTTIEKITFVSLGRKLLAIATAQLRNYDAS